jgi:hypothetical protein
MQIMKTKTFLYFFGVLAIALCDGHVFAQQKYEKPPQEILNVLNAPKALRGLGKTVQLCMLPYESHGYTALESTEHVLYEMLSWFDRYVKTLLFE